MSQVAPRRARRPVHGRVVAGVARGLAEHLNLPVWLLRLGFVFFTFISGIGIVLYAAFWAVLPLDVDEGEPGDESREAARAEAESLRASDTARLLALAALVIGIALLLAAAGVNVFKGFVIPLLVAVFGAALIWRQLDDEQRDVWTSAASRAARQTAGTAARAGRWRIVIGIGMVAVAVLAMVGTHTTQRQAIQGLAIALLILAGVALVAFPWVYRSWRRQEEQRRALIRSEERAEIASHVHDSVLQTLTLIQRYAQDPQEVTRLARTEERALRGWLYAPTGDPDKTFAAAVVSAAAEVEQSYGATIDVVNVGDALLTPELAALVSASREAMVNAARHGGGVASVFAEVDESVAEVFVRDRGPGFDSTTIPADRHGVRDSIVGRLERNGGVAEIKTAPGQGTEVRLRMPVPELKESVGE